MITHAPGSRSQISSCNLRERRKGRSCGANILQLLVVKVSETELIPQETEKGENEGRCDRRDEIKEKNRQNNGKNNDLSRTDGSTNCKEVSQYTRWSVVNMTSSPAGSRTSQLRRESTTLPRHYPARCVCYLVSHSGRKLLEPPIRVSIVQRVAITIQQLTFDLMAGQRPSTVRLLPRYRGQPALVCWMLPRPSRSWAVKT